MPYHVRDCLLPSLVPDGGSVGVTRSESPDIRILKSVEKRWVLEGGLDESNTQLTIDEVVMVVLMRLVTNIFVVCKNSSQMSLAFRK
mgnify:CR=1 FL=1